MRKSSYPMISVDDALCTIWNVASLLPPKKVSIFESLGQYSAENIVAREPFPSFPASIMDGYAVNAPIDPGTFNIQGKVLAGSADIAYDKGSVVYITTGAKLPDGFNAVVKIEDTESVPDFSADEKVKINVSIKPGSNVRQIGSDISVDEVIISEHTRIGASEIGLLATIGILEIVCRAQPVVGIMSTGDEIIDPWLSPTGTQIRDSNRATLLSVLEEDGIPCIDLGIIKDQETNIEAAILDAVSRCDVVITSGGVSMGQADLVKPTLEKLGTVHFGRLNMKPGKPTTFATVPRAPGKPTTFATVPRASPLPPCLFFALPGNPASCLVCKALLVDPALKRVQGLPPAMCLYPEVMARVGSAIELDPERPEYHRVILSYDFSHKPSDILATSTGGQRSSRLLSMRSANGLLCLPQGNGSLPPGSVVTALVVGHFASPASSFSIFQKAASAILPSPPPIRLSFPPASSALRPRLPSTSTSTSTEKIGSSNNSNSNSPVSGLIQALDETDNRWTLQPMRIALLTISDRASAGVYEDKAGPEMLRLIKEMPSSNPAALWPLSVEVVCSAIVPDDIELIQNHIKLWTDNPPTKIDVILTSGGTGFGPRDLTPEAVSKILDRHAQGVAQSLIAEGLKHTPLAVLSRPVAGTRGSTFICTLPGSVKAVRENIIALNPILPRIVQLIRSGHCLIK